MIRPIGVGVSLELRVEVPHPATPPVRHVLLETRDGPAWKLHQTDTARPGTSHCLPGLRPATQYRIRLSWQDTDASGRSVTTVPDIVVAFLTPPADSRVLLTVVIYCTGFEVSALVDLC